MKLTNEQQNFLKEMGEDNELNVFEKMYNLQAKFDHQLEVKRGLDFPEKEYKQLTTYALLSETAELLDELSWPWWKQVEEEKEGVINELRDLQHFILKLIKLQGMEPSDVYALIKAKYPELEDENDPVTLIEKASELKDKTLKASRYNATEERIAYLFFLISLLHTEYTLEETEGSASLVVTIQLVITTLFRDYGLNMEDVFVAYIDKNIENHNRQKGKSKDATRSNYSEGGSKINVEKAEDGFILTNENGAKFHLTNETLFELNRK